MGGYFENSGDLNFRRLVMLERVLVSIGIGVCILWSPGFSFCHSKDSLSILCFCQGHWGQTVRPAKSMQSDRWKL